MLASTPREKKAKSHEIITRTLTNGRVTASKAPEK